MEPVPHRSSGGDSLLSHGLSTLSSSPWGYGTIATALIAGSLGFGWYLGQRQMAVRRRLRQEARARRRRRSRTSSRSNKDNDDDEEEEAGSDSESSSSGSNDLDETEGSDSFLMPPDEDLKMVMCVRTDLNMQKGKMMAQCCHACLGAYRRAVKNYAKWVREWLTWGCAKIALKCPSEEVLYEIAKTAVEADLPCYVVEDAGRTQIAAGSRTVVAIGPAPKSRIDSITGPHGLHPLKLL
eukprot:gb/GECG01015897.1/.p1 GENE.gb/GECG01015897.1/~~gb/GECG01015897.1/.p1  ORF type:complete len:239 (+),score=22.74 gb/GECG01015897.1/:1-717(+)